MLPLLSASPWGPCGRTERSSRGSSRGTAERQQPARFWHPKHNVEELNVCSLITASCIRAIPGAQRPSGRDAPIPSSTAGPNSGTCGYRRRRTPYRAGSESFWPGPALRNFRSDLISWKNLRIATEPGRELPPERNQSHPPSHFRSSHVTVPGRGRGHHRPLAALSRRLCARSSRLFRSPRADRDILTDTTSVVNRPRSLQIARNPPLVCSAQRRGG